MKYLPLLASLILAGIMLPVSGQQNIQQTQISGGATRTDAAATGTNPSAGSYTGNFSSLMAVGSNGSTFNLVYEGTNLSYFGETLASVTIGPFDLVVSTSVQTKDTRVANRTRADEGYTVLLNVSGLYAVGTPPPSPLVDGAGWHYLALSMEQSTTSYTPSAWTANTSYPNGTPLQITNGNWSEAVDAPNAAGEGRSANMAENWHLDEIAVTGDSSTTRMADTSPGIEIYPVAAVSFTGLPTGTYTGDPATLPSPTMIATDLYPDYRIVALLTRPDGTVASLFDNSSSTQIPNSASSVLNIGGNATTAGSYTLTVWEETPIDSGTVPGGVSNPTATVGGYSVATWGWTQLQTVSFNVIFNVNLSQVSTYTQD